MRTPLTSLLALSLAAGCENKVPLPDSAPTSTDSPAVDSPVEDSPVDSAPGETATDTGPTPGTVTEEEVPTPVYDQIPVLLIDTDSAAIGDGDKTAAWLEVIEDHDGTLEDLDRAPRTYDGPIGIEIHGSSSAGYPKLPYRFETRDLDGEDLETTMVGLPDGTDWVLHAPYSDKTLLRNAYAYTLGASLAEDTGEWQPRTAFVELFLNGSYNGVYVLVERVQRDEDRLDISKVPATSAEGDISGGYIVKVDQHRSEGWTTDAGSPIDWVYPHADVLTAEQNAYLVAYFNEFETALRAEGWDDPTTGYSTLIAVDGWIDHYIINELANNIDAYRLSAYLYKDVEPGLLHAGPLWDFDRAFGDVNYCYAWATEGWIYDELDLCGYAYQYPFWWQHLLTDDTFVNQLRCRWESLRTDKLSDETLSTTLAALASEVATVEVRDDARWHTIGTYIDPNWYVGATWPDELAWLEAWVLARAAWMDDNLPGICSG